MTGVRPLTASYAMGMRVALVLLLVGRSWSQVPTPVTPVPPTSVGASGGHPAAGVVSSGPPDGQGPSVWDVVDGPGWVLGVIPGSCPAEQAAARRTTIAAARRIT